MNGTIEEKPIIMKVLWTKYKKEGNFIKELSKVKVGELPIPTKKGYIFDCWQDIKNNKIDENTIPVRNKTYYANWIKE